MPAPVGGAPVTSEVSSERTPDGVGPAGQRGPRLRGTGDPL
jgi:hypothetical protein